MVINLQSLETFTKLSAKSFFRGLEALQCFTEIPINCKSTTSTLIEVDSLISASQFQDDNIPSICLLQVLQGALDGFILFSSPKESASFITENLFNLLLNPPKEIEIDLQQSVLNEWVNIFAGNMTTSLSNIKTNKYIELSVTEQTYDLKNAALQFIACQMALKTDLLAVCHGSIKLEGSNSNIDIWIILNPSSELLLSEEF